MAVRRYAPVLPARRRSTPTLDDMRRRLAGVMFALGLAIGSPAGAVYPRQIDMAVLVAITAEARDPVIELLRREAGSSGLSCRVPERTVGLWCRDEQTDAALVASIEPHPYAVRVVAYRGRTNPVQVENVLRSFLSSISGVPSAQVLAAFWQGEFE